MDTRVNLKPIADGEFKKSPKRASTKILLQRVKKPRAHNAMMHKAAQPINIGFLNRVRYFSLDEARLLLPVVKKITQQTMYQVEQHQQILTHGDLTRADIANDKFFHHFLTQVEREKRECINAWQLKMEKLGVLVGDFGAVLFDTGHGYLHWQFPQVDIRNFVHYEADIGTKVSIEHIKQHHPHWLLPSTEQQSANDDNA